MQNIVLIMNGLNDAVYFQPGYCKANFKRLIWIIKFSFLPQFIPGLWIWIIIYVFQHNCLCQVFGEKYVRLYPHDQSEFLYPFDTEDLLSNTSQIDIEEDFQAIIKKFPKFNQAKGFECILYPGDILYIPPKCWHFVKSLSKSCSLSFWF